MKRWLSMGLALVMVCSLSCEALARTPDADASLNETSALREMTDVMPLDVPRAQIAPMTTEVDVAELEMELDGELTSQDMLNLMRLGYSPEDMFKAEELAKKYDKTLLQVLQMKDKTENIVNGNHTSEKTANTIITTQEEMDTYMDAQVPRAMMRQTEPLPEDAHAEAEIRVVSAGKTWDEIEAELRGDIITEEGLKGLLEQANIGDLLLEQGVPEETVSDLFPEDTILQEPEEALEFETTQEEEPVETAEADEPAEVMEPTENMELENTNSSVTAASVDFPTDPGALYNNYFLPKATISQYTGGGFVPSNGVSVNPLTKNLTNVETDLTLKGRGGLDLNLTRIYNAAEAYTEEVYLHERNSSVVDDEKFFSLRGNMQMTVYYDGELLYDEMVNCLFTPELKFVMTGDTVTSLYYDNPDKYFHNSMFAAYKNDVNDGGYDITYETPVWDGESYVLLETSLTSDYGNFNYHDVEEDLGRELEYPAEGHYDTRLKSESFSTRYSDLGAGWSFDFPFIEYRDVDGAWMRYLHFGTRGTWYIDEPSRGIYVLEDYPLEDLQITGESGTFNGQEYGFVLTEKDGKQYFFKADPRDVSDCTGGSLLGIRDRFGNEIKFDYFDNEETGSKVIGGCYYPRLKQITDTVGRTVEFTYTDDTVTVQVTDPNDSTQERTIVYDKSNFESGSKLDEVNNNGIVTGYTYKRDWIDTSLTEKFIDYDNGDYESVRYCLLNEIQHPTGMTTTLYYDTAMKNAGVMGVMTYPVATSIFSEDPLGDADNFKYYEVRNYTSEPSDGQMELDAAYDGYPYYNDLREVPPGYTFTVLEQDDSYSNSDEPESNHTRQIFHTYLYQRTGDRFDMTSKMLPYATMEFGLTGFSYSGTGGSAQKWDYKRETTYEYDWDTELCTKVVEKSYDDTTNPSQFGTPMTLITEYTYDSGDYGDVLSVRLNQDNNRKVSFTYEPTYHIPLTQTYKKDAATTIEITGTYSDTYKNLSQVITEENNVQKGKRTFVFDSYGNLTQDRNYANASDYTETNYDYTDNRTGSSKLQSVYPTRIYVTNVKDFDGNLVPAKSGNAAGVVDTVYTYDWFGNVISETDGQGNTYQYEYDTYNRPTKKTNPDGSSVSYSYILSEDENSVTITDELGQVKKLSYNAFGQIQEEKDMTANQVLKSYTHANAYSAESSVVTHSQFGNQTTEITTIDVASRPVSKRILDNAGTTVYEETYEYENKTDGGVVYSTVKTTVKGDSTAPAMTTTDYYDVYGNLAIQTRTHVENGTTKTYRDVYTYDLLGNRIQEKQARANDEGWSYTYTNKYDYDLYGNVVKQYDYTGTVVAATTYDWMGRAISTADAKGYAHGYATTTTYDALGRPLVKTTPISDSGTQKDNIIKYKYDRNGNVLEQYTSNNLPTDTTQKFEKVEYAYDARNNLVKTTGYTNNQSGSTDNYEVESIVQYAYDDANRLRRMYTGLSAPLTITGIDAVTAGGDTEYAVTKYEYNSLGQLTSQTDALGQTESFVYDTNGLLDEQTDRNGNTLQFQYTALGALAQRSVTTPASVVQDTETYTYAANGARKSMSNSASTTNYTYDDLGRVLTETTGNVTKSYTYDAANNLKSYTLKRGSATELSLSYTYDYKNRLQTVTSGGTIVAQYAYDANGNQSTVTTGSMTTEYAYNPANQITEVKNLNGSVQQSKYNYTYYTSGNQSQKIDAEHGTTTYAYDGLGRLVSETSPLETVSYQYTDAGNRSSKTVTGTSPYTVSYQYDANNRLTQESSTQGGTTQTSSYSYDDNGNMIGATGSSNALYAYDGWNRLTSAQTGGNTASYAYNADNLRVSKTVNGDTTGFILENGNVVAETDSSGIIAKYVYGLDLIYREVDGQKSYYRYNGHGDVTQLADGSGDVTSDYRYDAFGVEQDADAADTNPFRYAGEYYDSETGSIYLRNRYYNAATGRFTSEDPAEDGTNWYIYAGNNPVMFFDPSGNAKEGDDKYSLSVQEEIAIFGQVWADAEVAYNLGIIDYLEKKSVQLAAETSADKIRYKADHPILTAMQGAVEFTVFEILLGDVYGGTVYAADLSGPALEKMYGNENNLNAIVNTSPMVAVAGVIPSDKGRTITNVKINGKMTRVDIEFPQGGKPGNLHVQIKGTNQKIMINSIDDIAKLPKSVAKNQVITTAIKKGLKMLGKLF